MNRIIGIACVLTFIACSRSPGAQDETGAPANDKADDASGLAGSFINDHPGPGEITLLELNGDKTFAVVIPAMGCTTFPNCHVDVISGQYRLTESASGKTHFLRLEQNSTLRFRYAWTLSGDALSLKDTTSDEMISMTRRAPSDEELCDDTGGTFLDNSTFTDGTSCRCQRGTHFVTAVGCVFAQATQACGGSSELAVSCEPGLVCQKTNPLCLECTGTCVSPACAQMSQADCMNSSNCVWFPGQPCDPTPGGPACPPDLAPHCADR
jgi:hypothetical protein